MPKVGGKKFPYTAAGMKAAKKAATKKVSTRPAPPNPVSNDSDAGVMRQRAFYGQRAANRKKNGALSTTMQYRALGGKIAQQKKKKG